MAFLIFVADDDEDDFDLLNEAFEELNEINLLHAKNGKVLIDDLNYMHASNDKLPDLILLDINMPKIDGLKALEYIKSSKPFMSIPVIMYTTSNNNDQRKKCFLLGADGFITKANNFKELKLFINYIDNFLKRIDKIVI